MSETTKNIESKQARKFPGTPVTGDILKKVLSIFNAAADNPKRWEAIRFELRSRDGDDRHITRCPQNPGILIICGPHFRDQVDPDKPETFEFLDLVVEPGFLGAIEEESTDDELEKIRSGVRYSAPISRSYNSCP